MNRRRSEFGDFYTTKYQIILLKYTSKNIFSKNNYSVILKITTKARKLRARMPRVS